MWVVEFGLPVLGKVSLGWALEGCISSCLVSLAVSPRDNGALGLMRQAYSFEEMGGFQHGDNLT